MADTSSLEPITQIAVGLFSVGMGIAAYVFGSKKQPEAPQNGWNNFVSLENAKLRTDLEHVLAKHREALELRISQQSDGIQALVNTFSERLRDNELAIARLQAREEIREEVRRQGGGGSRKPPV